MVLSRLTKITGPGIHTLSNVLSHNIKSSGIITATKFSGPLDSIGGNFAGVITATGGSFSGNVTAVDGTFSGNVSIAGTLTYEDVTNIDSVGIITAPALDVDDFISVGSNIHLGNAGVVTATSFVGSGAALTGIDATAVKDSGGNVKIQAQASGAVYTGIHTFITLKSTSGTFTGDIDVDGHTNLDNVSVAGVTTFSDTIKVGTGVTVETNGQATFTGIVTASNFVKSDGSSVGASSNEYYLKHIDSSGNASANGGNMFGGYRAGGQSATGNITSGEHNHAIGWECGEEITSGNYNTLYGHLAGTNIRNGNANVAMGYETLLDIRQNHGNVALGSNALRNLDNGDYNFNVAIGYYALRSAAQADRNIGIGQGVGASLSNGDRNTFLGAQAGGTGTNDITTGSNNILLGNQAQATSATVSNEVTIGNSNINHVRVPGIGVSFSEGGAVISGIVTALNFVKTDGTTVGGAMTGYNNDPGENNVTTFIAGRSAGNNIQLQNSDGQSAHGNVLIGDGAGKSAQNQYDYNVSIGSYANYNLKDGSYNVSIGYGANRNVSTQVSSNTIAIGYETLINFVGGGTALVNGRNTVVGHAAAGTLVSGGNNLVLGMLADVSSANISNEITLGNTSINHLRVPGIGVSFSAGGAVISGIVTATSFSGDGSALTGISAGTSLSGSTNNTVCTVTGANAIQGESQFTYDGTSVKNLFTSASTATQAEFRNEHSVYGGGVRFKSNNTYGTVEIINYNGSANASIYNSTGGWHWTGNWQTHGGVSPWTDNTYDLGSSSKRWRNLYTTDLQLSNKGSENEVDGTWGDWTLQEGENDIFMINNRTGKKFAITMREVE